MLKKGCHISKVLGVKIDCIREDQVLETVEKWLLTNRGRRYILTPINPEMVMLAQKDNRFLRVLNGADLRIADGMGLRLADKRLKRVAGTSMMMSLIELAVKKSWRVFLLGGRGQAAERAAEKLRNRYSGLEIKGESGPEEIGKERPREKQNLSEQINRFKPHLLFVGFGQVKQEKWIAKNLAKLKVRVAMGVGGAIDQVVKPWLRAPKLCQCLGLEWLWRLLMQPWRLKRQLVLVRFVWLVISDKYLGGGQRRE